MKNLSMQHIYFKRWIAAALVAAVLAPCSFTVSTKGAPRKKRPAQTETRRSGSSTLSVVHPPLKTKAVSADGKISLELVNKKQNFQASDKITFDTDVNSPKSINVHPNGRIFYVNSLEGCRTVAYDLTNHCTKVSVIDHKFDNTTAHLWAPESGLYPFRHYTKNLNTFSGKPVESVFTHGGKYLWIPYYRRSFDINAQDPSAIAIIDTDKDKIIRVMEAGVLPKMVAVSPDGKTLAVTHWGDNTVGLIDIASANPKDWKHTDLIAIDKQIKWDLSLTTSVDRDSNSGNALRGTAFTPDSKYLLVGCMGGNGGIAVIDMASKKYLGKIFGMMPNLRHIVIKNGYVYLSINSAGYVQRIPLKTLLEAIPKIKDGKTTITGWESCKVGNGARTIELSPDGKYLYAACNQASKLVVVDTQKMENVLEIDVDSYPVGLDVTPNGRFVIVTSQGRSHKGGNCVDIFYVERK